MAKKKKSAKRRTKSKKPAGPKQDPIGDLLKRLSKTHKKGGIRGILTITLGPDINSSNLQWGGQTPSEEMIGPLTIAQRLYVDGIINRMNQRQQEQKQQQP